MNNNFNFTMTYYQKKENKKLLRLYGAHIYNHSLQLENENTALEPLKNHHIDKKFRTKLINWLFEVFYVMNSMESTIYLTVHLLDYYLFKLNTPLKNENLHLLGIACLFIASKFEDITPIFMNDLVNKIAHGKFNEGLIKTLEKSIMNLTNFNVIISSSYDFIITLFCEFRITNKFFFNYPSELKSYFMLMEKYSIYISKIILHFDEFSGFKNSMKAICCITISFEVVRTLLYKPNNEEIMKKWILSLIENSGFDPNTISLLYNKISEYYKNFNSLIPDSNLTNMTDLSFCNE